MKDLQALTLVGLTRENLIPNPLAILSLDNRQFINICFTTCKRLGSTDLDNMQMKLILKLRRSEYYLFCLMRTKNEDLFVGAMKML